MTDLISRETLLAAIDADEVVAMPVLEMFAGLNPEQAVKSAANEVQKRIRRLIIEAPRVGLIARRLEWKCNLGNGEWDHDWQDKCDDSGGVDGGPSDQWAWRECRVCGEVETHPKQHPPTKANLKQEKGEG